MKTMILALFIGLSAFVSAQNCQVGNSCNGTVSASDGGNCTTANACVSLPLAQNTGAVGLSLGGTFTATIQFEASADNGATWNGISGTPLGSTTTQLAATGVGAWRFAVSGLTNIRVRGSAYASGSAVVTFQTSPTAASLGGGGAGVTTFDQLGAGTNTGNAFGIGAGGTLAPTGGGTITANVGAFSGATQYFFPVFGAGGTIGNSLCSTDAGLTVLTCTYSGGLSITGSGSGKVTLSGSTSGSAAFQVAAVAGTPNPLQLPTATSVGAKCLQSDGGNPQVLSWVSCGGGSGTVNTGTTGHLAYYASSTTAVSDMGADFTFTTHTLSGGASGLFDLSASNGANAFKVPVGAGLTSGADGVVAYDSTGKLTHVRTNGADSSVVAATGTSTTTTQVLHATAVAGIGAFSAIAAADLPNPSASTLGGIESFASVSHQFINTISTSGVPNAAQPAISDISNLYLVDAQSGTSYTIVAADCGKLVTFNNAAATAVTLPQATGSFVAPCHIGVENLGAGVVTITPTTSTIAGLTAIALNQLQGVIIQSDSTNYQVLNFTPSYLPVAAQVNTIQIGGVATAANPTIAPIGSDTNIGVDNKTKGTGAFRFLPGSDSTSAFRVRNAADSLTQFVVDTSTQRVGVGVTTPSATLDLVGKYTVSSAGINAKYNNIATVSNGHAAEYATVDLTAQSAAITATTLYAVPAAANGMYRVCFVAKVTTAATTSSTLGGAAGFQITYTDQDDSVVVTTLSGAFWDSNATNIALNTTQAHMGGCTVVNAKASTNIQYIMGYTSSGGTAMQYNLHIKAEAL